jgi:hypothetical protein
MFTYLKIHRAGSASGRANILKADNLRSNWQDYVQEFARALQLAGRPAPRVGELAAQEPLTPFERKYAGSGHALWRLVTS